MRIHSLVVAFGALAFAAQPALSQDAKLLERGTYLMNSIVACGNCHAQRDKQGRPIAELGLSGGEVFDEKPFKAYASNITPDPETGVGKWTEAQLIRGIREGIRPDGSLIGPPMPIHMYRGISDDDARALVAYLRAQPPVKNVVPKYDLSHQAAAQLWAADQEDDRRAVAQQSGQIRRVPGRTSRPLHRLPHSVYLLSHASDIIIGAGSTPFPGPGGVSVSRNLTPTALKGWSDAEIARAIREGKSRDGSPLKPPMALWWYKNINDQDMAAIVAYLRCRC